MDIKKISNFQIKIGWCLIVLSGLLGIGGYHYLNYRFSLIFDEIIKVSGFAFESSSVDPNLVTLIMQSHIATSVSAMITGEIMLLMFVIILMFIGILFLSQGIANYNLQYAIRNKKIDSLESGKKFKRCFILSFAFISIIFLASYDNISFAEYIDGETTPESILIVFGFPLEYMEINKTYKEVYSFAFFELMANLYFSFIISLTISLIYYKFILNQKHLKLI